MNAMASQITGVSIIYPTVCFGADQSSASLASVRGIHRLSINHPHKGPVTRKMFPFDNVFMGPFAENPLLTGSQKQRYRSLMYFLLLAWTSFWTDILLELCTQKVKRRHSNVTTTWLYRDLMKHCSKSAFAFLSIRSSLDIIYSRVFWNLNKMVGVLQVIFHDNVIKWKHFPRYWPFVQGIHWSPVNSPHKGQWREALMFSLICAWINAWVNNREAGDLRRHRAHYDVFVMFKWTFVNKALVLFLKILAVDNKSVNILVVSISLMSKFNNRNLRCHSPTLKCHAKIMLAF